ncbi:uncharacterized protein LOC118480302 [Helianthus annuus]|uniref:uncharacterized protein LOC118480302 n=1 Tax=Helianthus annuus TaxID=4232 RepID=UPI001653366F|nr:uncharacterized protein LOC118480302 [Helianthus annuus]
MPDTENQGESSVTLVSKLDASDPLYLHASDSSSLTIVNIKLKGTENYVVWSNAMKLALTAKNKLGFINGTCTKSTKDDVLASQWDICNSVVLTWILNSVSEELYVGQVYSRLDSEVWSDLKDTYDRVDGSVVFGLYQKINSVNQNGASVSEYYHKLNTMWKQFDAMVQLPSCTCDASTKYNEFSQLIKLMQFLMGLDDIYQPVRTNLLTRDPLPTVKTAFSIIYREESHRDSNKTSKIPNVGFVAKATQYNENKKRFKKGPNPNLKCTHCNKVGHVIEKCFELHGYPPNYRNKSNQNNSQWSKTNVSANSSVANAMNDQSANSSLNALTADQFSKLLGLLNENKLEDSAKSNMSGANQHMVMNNDNMFNLVDVSEYDITIKHPNGTDAKDVSLKRNLVIGRQMDGLYFCGGRTPYELLYGFEPSLDHLKVFGCLCYFTVLTNTDKLEERELSDVSLWDTQILKKDTNFGVWIKGHSPSHEIDTNPNDEEKESPDCVHETQQHSSSNEPVDVADTQQSFASDDMANAQHHGESQSESVRVESSVVNYANLSSENMCFVANLNKTSEPVNYKEARKARNKVLSLVPLLKQNIDPCAVLHAKSCG